MALKELRAERVRAGDPMDAEHPRGVSCCGCHSLSRESCLRRLRQDSDAQIIRFDNPSIGLGNDATI
jgi:hypothetical protein